MIYIFKKQKESKLMKRVEYKNEKKFSLKFIFRKICSIKNKKFLKSSNLKTKNILYYSTYYLTSSFHSSNLIILNKSS